MVEKLLKNAAKFIPFTETKAYKQLDDVESDRILSGIHEFYDVFKNADENSTFSLLDAEPKVRLLSKALRSEGDWYPDIESRDNYLLRLLENMEEQSKDYKRPKSFDRISTEKDKNVLHDLSEKGVRDYWEEEANEILNKDALTRPIEDNEYFTTFPDEIQGPAKENAKVIQPNDMDFLQYLDYRGIQAEDLDAIDYAERLFEEEFTPNYPVKSLKDDPHAVAEAQQRTNVVNDEIAKNKNAKNTQTTEKDIFIKRLKEANQKGINTFRENNHGYYPSKDEIEVLKKDAYKQVTRKPLSEDDIKYYGTAPQQYELAKSNREFAENKEKVSKMVEANIYMPDELLDAMTRKYISRKHIGPKYELNALPRKSKAEMNKQYKKYEKSVWSDKPDTKEKILQDYKYTVKSKKQQDPNYIGSKEYGQDRKNIYNRLDNLDRTAELSKQKKANRYTKTSYDIDTQSPKMDAIQQKVFELLQENQNQPLVERYLDNLFGNREEYKAPSINRRDKNATLPNNYIADLLEQVKSDQKKQKTDNWIKNMLIEKILGEHTVNID